MIGESHRHHGGQATACALTGHLEELGLVGHGVEPAHHVGEGGAELGAAGDLEGVHQGGGQGDVGEGDGVAHQVGLVGQVLLDNLPDVETADRASLS